MSTIDTARRHQEGRLEYKIYFAVLFPFFLVGSLASRLFSAGFSARYTDDLAKNGNIFNDTTASLNSVLPWIYMGR